MYQIRGKDGEKEIMNERMMKKCGCFWIDRVVPY